MRSIFFAANAVKSRGFGIVDTVDKPVRSWDLQEKSCQKIPHSGVECLFAPNVDNVYNLATKQMFAHVYDISGTHSYQQVPVDRI
jgi:hypothetical protein